MSVPLTCVVLAAGLGTRMKSDLPKVLHPVAHRPMVRHVLAAAEALEPAAITVVIGPDMPQLAEAVRPHATCVQAERRGTADALLAARDALAAARGDVLVLYGDTPLVRPESLRALLAARRAPEDPAVVVMGFRPADPGPYGRLLLDSDGGLVRIVEAADATPDQRRIGLCNGGILALDAEGLLARLDRITNDNVKGEFYLTDLVAIARAEGRACAVVEGTEEDVLGVNARAELAAVEARFQARARAAAMAGGATLTDPGSVWFAADTRLGRDVTVGPHVVFGPGVEVADGVEILPFCHLEGVRIARGARIGPFARLRPGTRIGADVHIGNFVEVKATVLEEGSKANHLAYLGDAQVGARTNIGAGTITCNYDGFLKHRTEIGADVFVGSDTALVAPVTVGDGAIIGAGSVIVRDVPPDSVTVARGEQTDRPGAAPRLRERKRRETAARAAQAAMARRDAAE